MNSQSITDLTEKLNDLLDCFDEQQKDNSDSACLRNVHSYLLSNIKTSEHNTFEDAQELLYIIEQHLNEINYSIESDIA